MNYKSVAVVTGAIVVGSCWSFTVAAQDISEAHIDENRSDKVIEEVLVTASKRSQSQQDVGLSVAAFSGKNLRELGVDDAMGLVDLVPGTGISQPNGGGIPVIIIRGIGLQNFRINDTPTTAIYVDEVYQTSVAQAVATMFDLERVEVLKGPQGGLYGRNAVGGAIQIISSKPSFDGFEGYASAKYERYDRVESELVLSGPISDTLAFRVGGKLIQGGGYFHSTTGDFDYGDADRFAGRALFEFRPNEDVNALLKIHGGNDESELPLARQIGIYQPLGLNLDDEEGIPDTADGAILNSDSSTASLANICTAVLSGGRSPGSCETLNGMTPDELGISSRYDSASLSKPFLDNKWWGVSLQVDVDVNDAILTSITSYDDFTFGRYIDQDGSPEIQQEIDYGSKIEAWSQEFRLSSDYGESIKWLLGVNYAEDELDENSLLLTETGLLKDTLGGLTRSSQLYVQSTEAFSTFGRVDWGFIQDFNLVLELRYTNEEKSIVGGTYLPQVNVTLADTDDSTTYDAVSGKLGVEYTPSDDSLLYASYSEGFKSGGYFGGFATNPAQLDPFDQETISAVEVGFKSDFPEQSLRLNGAAYYYDRQDVQGNGIDTSGIVPIARLTSIGDVEVYGVDLESIWKPLDKLTVLASASWLKNEIVSSDLVSGNIFGTSSTESYVGARLPNQSELSANLSLKYEDYVSGSLLGGLQISYVYRGEQDLGLVFSKDAGALLTEDAYDLVNIQASIGPDDLKWKLSLYVENVFDQEYRVNAGGGAPAGFQEIYGAPRIFGLGLEYNF